MSKRKERKARRIELAREWALITAETLRENKVKDKNILAVILESQFRIFCISNHIDRLQDKTLRTCILLDAENLLKLIFKAKVKG